MNLARRGGRRGRRRSDQQRNAVVAVAEDEPNILKKIRLDTDAIRNLQFEDDSNFDIKASFVVIMDTLHTICERVVALEQSAAQREPKDLWTALRHEFIP